MEAIKNRYEFVMLFDVENGNPNGDPDAGNQPRTDPESRLGIVTDVCIKRKIRNYVELVKDGEAGYNILVKNDRSLNSKFTEAYDAQGLAKGKSGANKEDVAVAQRYMCANYFDVRAFGAVMNTGGDRCGTVRGPVQINFARSVDPVFQQDLTITRQAKTTDDRQQQKGDTEIGKKSIVYYGLYRAEGYISAALAQKITGFSEDDLELLWNAVINMFEHDRSAARGKMCMRKLYVFKHASTLGNAPAHILFDKIRIAKKCEGAPRNFSDYEISVDAALPDGVELMEKL